MKKEIFLSAILAVFLVLVSGFVAFIISSDSGNDLTGYAVSQVYVQMTPPENCSIDLKEGINMVSFYCEEGIGSLNESLVDENGAVLDYKAVFVFNPNNLNDSWSSYNPSVPLWATQSLSSLDRRKGYAIILNAPGRYYNEGYEFTSTNINLVEGWNFIGYPKKDSKNVSLVLASLDGYYEKVESYQVVGGNNEWKLYIPGVGGTLTTMEPMIGYWIFVNESKILSFN